jgi:hypothetical protein
VSPSNWAFEVQRNRNLKNHLVYLKKKKMEIQHLTRTTYIVVNLSNGETLFMGGLEECEDYLWSGERQLERDYMY